MPKVRQRDKDASLEHKSKPFVKTDTKKSKKKSVRYEMEVLTYEG